MPTFIEINRATGLHAPSSPRAMLAASALASLLLLGLVSTACSDDDGSGKAAANDATAHDAVHDGTAADGTAGDGTAADGTAGDGTGGDTGGAAFVPGTPVATGMRAEGAFVVRGSVGQVFVSYAAAESTLELRDGQGSVVSEGKADKLGSLIYRKVAPGEGYRVNVKGTAEDVGPVRVLALLESAPKQAFYDGQKIAAGTGYITMRDGTQLSYFATLPGPAADGPYPTVVNYSGYSPSKPGESIVGPDQAFYCDVIPVLCNAPADPSSMVAAVSGYATVNVNIRGTGCSGGAYDYFEQLQLLDGYDVIETVAAQAWVKHHKVGMVGLSYPGITQMFVARTVPPGLAAIAPVSVIGNTVTTLVPGGILNKGFAVAWIDNVYKRAAPYGQGWEQGRVDAGDMVCKENQLLHDQRVNNVDQAKNKAYFDNAIIDPLNPTAWVHEIKVPVFLASSFQDEQTGPFFTTLLNRFTGSPSRRFMTYNGVHSDGFAPQILVEWKAFLDLYVAKVKPNLDGVLGLLIPQFTDQVFEAKLELPADRWKAVASYEDALAKWKAEPEMQVLFDNGGGEPYGAPVSTFRLGYASWPPPATAAKRWYFHADGSMAADAPSDDFAASRYRHDPTAGDRGILGPNGNLWKTKPNYKWTAPAKGFEVAFTSAPLSEDTIMAGTGSVDLWVRCTATDVEDADIEVNLSEVRPDGQEIYVQSGWLRVSHRKLKATSTELWPEPTLTKNDIELLVPGKWTQARVAIAGFGHAFRKDSRIRIAIDTPGDSRADWRFDLVDVGANVSYDISHDKTRPSSVALPVIAGGKIPAGVKTPPCGSLRGQPCRPVADHANTPIAP